MRPFMARTRRPGMSALTTALGAIADQICSDRVLRLVTHSDISGRFLLRCTGLTCYSYRPAFWPWDKSHETARVHHVARRRTHEPADPIKCATGSSHAHRGGA